MDSGIVLNKGMVASFKRLYFLLLRFLNVCKSDCIHSVVVKRSTRPALLSTGMNVYSIK